jgi:hypothetical protein
MRTSTVENELEGTLRFLDVNQKMEVLSFIKDQMEVKRKSITKRDAIRDIRTALKGQFVF